MDTSRHRLLDSQFLLHSAFGDAWFFDRIARSYEPSVVEPGAMPAMDIRVHHASAAELADAAAGWPAQARFHRSLNYPHWNLEGPADAGIDAGGAIHLPGEGMLFRHDARRACLDVHIDPMRAVRSSELIFHAARNLTLWRRGPRFAPMLHASLSLIHI